MRKNLVQKREECNLKQTEVASFLNITPRHYRQLEAGTSEGSVPIWKKLAQRFNTTIDCLLSQAEETTQGNYNSSGQNGVAEAKELNEAAQDFMIDVETILDIGEDGRLDCPERRAKAERIRKAIEAVLE
ncbi:MAG: helix-turn-helix transcriptional regulator [Paludibacter sp.]|nr:helix-turn-helix transcriptional regulator [Paludibacter sp.]